MDRNRQFILYLESHPLFAALFALSMALLVAYIIRRNRRLGPAGGRVEHRVALKLKVFGMSFLVIAAYILWNMYMVWQSPSIALTVIDLICVALGIAALSAGTRLDNTL